MREGLGKYRGKDFETGEWRYGNLIHGVGACHGNVYILPIDMWMRTRNIDGYKVDPETVGEWVHTNTEGVDIYEGDWTEASWGEQGLVEFDSFIYAKVECRVSDDIKPVGNIHDNPQPWEEQA